MGARIAVQRRPRDVGGRAREHIGDDSLGLDDAAIAEARLARRLGQSVDERDRSAARLKRSAAETPTIPAPRTMASTSQRAYAILADCPRWYVASGRDAATVPSR